MKLPRYVQELTVRRGRSTEQHGFQVRLLKYGVSRWFGIGPSVSRTAALKRAVDFRDAILEKRPTPAQRKRHTANLAKERKRRRQ